MRPVEHEKGRGRKMRLRWRNRNCCSCLLAGVIVFLHWPQWGLNPQRTLLARRHHWPAPQQEPGQRHLRFQHRA